ncbi:arcadin 1 [Caldivirga sp. UBA161]|uniref:arcadin 1 n=1 Tax=Caldivirga sp. UBA161 TaxID=1915569 RepID=UPI0025C4F02E|nr:arcadin 1 [Caldivirga sp. UBA161]
MAGFKGYVVSKTLIMDPFGGKMFKIDIVEERENPGLVATGSGESSALSRDMLEMMQNIFRSIPMLGQMIGGKVPIPRVTLMLTEEEMDELGGKMDVGEYVYVKIQGGKITIEKEQ